MFTTLVTQPIFNLLVLIYALLPGHNFGLAIIIFTIVIRLMLWPLVKKQLHHTKAMQKLQPEIKAIKKKAKGDKVKESQMLTELLKERELNPFGSLLTLIPQMIVLFGLYLGLNKVVHDPEAIVSFAYPFLQDLSWMQHLAANIGAFDETLFGLVDLTRAASSEAGIYVPALIIVFASAVVQYYQSKQLLPKSEDARKLREIFKAAGQGEQADPAEMQAAMSRTMIIFLPVIVFVVTLGFPSALGLYWLVGGIVAIIQQGIVLREDEVEMEAIADAPDTSAKTKSGKARRLANIPEAEIVPSERPAKPQTKASAKKASKNKRKKR